MKNIHVLPTPKPSRLWFYKQTDILLTGLTVEKSRDIDTQNIYITNDEEIKEGDWCYDKVLNLIFQTDNHTDFKYANQTDYVLKIILTTDQDLIADGVQAIDDEFLEWFVKNPSCEKVKVNKEYVTPLGDVVETCYDNERLNYKIIIPKQETLEEASNNYINSDKTPNDYESFIEGAKWQQERMYSETEVESLLQRFRLYSYNHGCGNAEFEEWFNEFKKK